LSRKAKIAGTGSYLPSRVLTNFDLSRMVETSDEWITTRTGIKERRIAEEDEATSDLASIAAERAILDAGIGPEDVDFIIVATVTPDMFFPSTACIVQDRIGARNAGAVDILAACSGFIYGLSMARSFVESGEYRTVLVIAGDVLSKITDWQDRSTCVLFGDGAGAAVVVASDEDGRGILGFDIGADGSAGDLLKIPGGGSRIPISQRVIDERLHYIKMVGNEVFKYAVRVMERSVLKLLGSLGLSAEDIGCFIPHQANMRIISAMVERLGIPMDVVYVNVDRYGNVSAASVAIALDEARKEGRIKDGDLVVMTAFGGGFTWGSCAVRW